MNSRLVLAIVVCAGVAACSKNVTTGRTQFSTLTPEQERQIGNEAAPELTKEYGGAVQDPELRAYITEVGQKIVVHTEVDGPQRQWEFTLLDSDVINAFALPGEKVFMSRGLADQMTNEAQLAGVLGHEVGHVMARHTSERIAQSTLFGTGLAAAGAVVGAVVKDPTVGAAAPAIGAAGGSLIVLKFSRDQESEADSLGMRYMTKAGYNPEGQLQVMQILDRESKGGSAIEWLATHPLPQTRIDRIKASLQKDYAYTEGNSQYQFYEVRFQDRYLSRRGLPKSAASEAGSSRLLARVVLEDPTTWCGVCAARAAAAGETR
ncbi:MAG: M48 family metalloprotease [Phycisphaeraceae bacterium]|nr:M48 family metalloprotease [Phycisphaeraceae bacterium]